MKKIVTFELETPEVEAIDQIAGRDTNDIRTRSAILRMATREFISRQGFIKPSPLNRRKRKKNVA